ncbi:MAG TPA: class I SAM-dependent methyltransferase [Polyangiales bacterium]|jgi:predicted O-methyltransferase YrrM|nr:class I SAM-dependent methyltransferase [Polyangiales bacterium]
MQFEEIDAVVGELPGIPWRWGRRLYDFVLAHKPKQLLELGFWHGKSSCYTAAALHELGAGHLTTVDLESARKNEPNIHELLKKTGLSSFVTVNHEATSYTWFLKKALAAATVDGHTVPKYDLCFIDGAHSWEADGLSFFLADKLLNPGGYMLFDDYSWSYATSTALKNTDFVRNMPADEREEPHVKLIFELLVKQHPSYGEFLVEENNWAWAKKLTADEKAAVRTETRVISPVTQLQNWLGARRTRKP